FPIGSPTETPNGEAVSTTYGYAPVIAIHDGTVDVSWYYYSTYDLYTRERNGSWGPIINHGIYNSSCYYPAIAFDSDGNLHNVFNRYYSGYRVYYQRKNAGASSYSSPVEVYNPGSYRYAYYPSICITSDDAIHVSVAHNNGYRLVHAWSDDNGATWDNETIGGTYFAYYSYGTSICCDSDDNLYIAYVSYDSPRQTYVATNASGSWVSTQVSQSTYTRTYYPSICCDKNDNIWVSWDDRSGATYEIHYNKYDAVSGSWQGDSALTTDDGNYSRYSNFAADENGNVHVCWYDRRDGNYEVYYNWYKGVVAPKPPFVDTLFCEYFEGSWLPPGWSQIIYNTHTQYGYPCTWFHGDYSSNFHHGSYGAYVWFSYYYQNEWLKTFPIDLTGYDPEDSVDLTLGSAFYGTPAVNNFICVSTDGGATWSDTIVDLCSDYETVGWTYIDDYPNPLSYRISEYIGQTIMIGFNYYWFGASGGRGVWSIDDVCVIVSGGSLGPGEDSLDLAITHIIRPHSTNEKPNVPFTPEILVANNLDTTAHALMRCKIKDNQTMETVYEDVLSVVPLEPGENFVKGFKDFTPEGGKEYNALFVLEHPDDVNPDNDHKDKNFKPEVGMDVTPFEIVLPADVQDGSFAPTAKYTEKASVETEANVICEITESGASVYKESVSHTFAADETWTATFPVPGIESGTYTITFWAENPEDGSNISFPPISKTFTYTTSIAETPVPERTGLEVLGHTVNFALSEASHVNIRVYDAAGKAVTTLVDGSRGPGSYTTNWNTSGVAAGVYFVRMITPEFHSTCKVMVLH
ncbi:MAG: T9SS type A sorting domain-containing protein, partial [candidate division WOR-3 bacterium]|nr:T9SS type A sorting domain-containing protein [candidate division WOR-3 bacterium]